MHRLAAQDKYGTIIKNSLREKVRREFAYNSKVAKEIDKMQTEVEVRGPMANRLDALPFSNRVNFEQYIKSDAELAVDPVMNYLRFPQRFKTKYPETFKFMQGHFNRASSPINIYTNPLATILAILMAGAGVALRGPGEDDEEGALNMQRGALSA
jgi:hypothetical protein